MLRMITGLPGNAKTLFAISTVQKQALAENRPVYYHGIKELTLNWTPLVDPKKWFDVPPNSIVVIDEAQEIFRNRSVGSHPPEHVTALETHRHLGIDLVFLTQHPSFLDPHVRKLTNLHQHMMRVYGMEMSTIHQWRETRDNPDKNRKDSEQSKWAFDKAFYGTYKSAEVHTMKRQLPKRLFFLIAVPFILAGLCYATYWLLTKKVGPGAPVDQAHAVGQVAQVGGAVAGAPVKRFDPVEDARNYVAMNTPRVVGLPQTAPKYDRLTEPKRVPVPAACIERSSVHGELGANCKCFTQQGTPMSVQPAMCVEFARNGFFQDFDPDADKQAAARTERSVQVLSSRPDAPLPSATPSAPVLIMDAVAEAAPTGKRGKS